MTGFATSKEKKRLEKKSRRKGIRIIGEQPKHSESKKRGPEERTLGNLCGQSKGLK